ncbi:UDP-glycosyltransferase 73C11-like [Carya illinoinensis]|nr:UDP-glycosyltransferase 73C11-like [Carya illinoinensis]XP_042943600.1 UDP-glycosyltransferase 73C11-like [Carya illinoinensis]XP_042943601.1 UDP-glycosyltransferase 73C11-like [Carya illinoinensis]
MASPAHKLHFVLFPLMAQGHMIPLIDIAKLLAQRGMIVTIVTTTHNAARFHTSIARAVESGLRIQVIQLQFPYEEAGIPKGCDNLDKLPSLGLAINFFTSTSMLRHPVEKLFEDLAPPPNCIISDMCLPWTLDIARKFHIPRFSFLGVSCFCLLIFHVLRVHNIHAKISSQSEYFVLPGLPDHFEFTKSQLPFPEDPKMKEFSGQMAAADLASQGVIVNTFQELEPAYAKEYRKAREDKVWCIGPVSLCNKDYLDRAERGNKASIEEYQCLKWLDAQEPCAVVYACLGSLCNLIPSQLIELGLALEESNKPFIWVLRGAENSEELEKWILEDRYEERIKGRGLLIWGWAPQLLILSHPSVGGFLTHCGWNSCIEGISAGVPMLTWPLFGDQFMNEKLVVQVLKIGVRVGVEDPVNWGEEEKTGVLVKKEDVKGAIERLMNEGEEREERRTKVREMGEMAKRAVEDGGSSQVEMTMLIRGIMLRTGCRECT